jgi:hypothetical protein
MFSQVLRGRVCYVFVVFFQGRVGYVSLDLPAAFWVMYSCLGPEKRGKKERGNSERMGPRSSRPVECRVGSSISTTSCRLDYGHTNIARD